MIVPCIDLMGGKVVQLIQGREKALEGDSPEAMLRRFAAFPQIQVIDIDAANIEQCTHQAKFTMRRRQRQRGTAIRINLWVT